MTLIDAGPLFALLDRRETHHAVCVATLTQISTPIITTWPCFTEAMYLAHRSGGWPMQQLLWQYYEAQILRIHTLSSSAVDTLPALMQKYRDTPMDLADASLVVAANELEQLRIFTLDKHFHAYRSKNGLAFSVVPELSQIDLCSR